MNLNKKQKSVIAIYGIIALVLILITLVVPFKKPGASWTMFAFSLVAIVFSACVCIIAFKNKEKLMSKFYGFPVFRIGILYVAIQLALTLIFYVIGAFVNVHFGVGFAISVLLLGAAAIGSITADNARDIIEEIDNKEFVSVQRITSFNIEISEIVEMCKDEDIKPLLSKLESKFKYSDPVSSPSTADKEKEIADELESLKALIISGSKTDIVDAIDRISIMLSTRNRMCEAGKR